MKRVHMSPKGLGGRVVSDERGQSLLLAIVIMAALTITTAGVISFMGSNEVSAGRDRDVERALSGAEAGLSNGFSRIVANDATNSVITPTTWTESTTVDGAQVTYTATKSSSTDNSTTPPTTTYYWTVKGTGTYRNAQRIVQQQIKYIQGTHIDASVDYKYGLFVGAPPAGTNPACLITLGGNVTAKANVYIGGNLCTNGGVSLTPTTAHQLAVYIKGYWNGKGSGSIGTSAVPFAIARIQGGCLDNKGNSVICSNKTNVFADDTNTTPFPDLKKPTVHGDTIYAASQNGWNAAGTCSGGFILDTNSAIDQSVSNTLGSPEELFPSTGYSCSVLKTDGTTATMTWAPATNTFTISGTLYIDGDVSMKPTGSSNVNWTGNGTIYVNGVLSKGSNNNICGPPKAGSGPTGFGCPQTWDTTSITRNGTTTLGSNVITGLAQTSDLAVGMYVNGVSGSGVPAGTKITAINDSSSITVSQNATASGTSSMTFNVANFGVVILNPTNATNGFSSTGNGEMDMDMYLVAGFANSGGTIVTGSVIADGGTVNGGTGFLYPQTPPPDFPLTYDTPDIGWSAAPSTWQELK